jgi:hypothetical protein
MPHSQTLYKVGVVAQNGQARLVHDTVLSLQHARLTNTHDEQYSSIKASAPSL